jgi:pimeloyl-ACP methyl ester carboxylesterase
MTTPHHSIGSGSHHVFCLHGWFGSSRGWGQDFVDVLDGDRFTYHFVDYRGYGDRMDVTGDYTIDEAARDTLALADELGVDDFSVVGHSMGGSAAQRVAVLAPERVRRLVGVSPVPASGVPFDDDSWALFSGAAEQDQNRAAIIDFTTGNRLTRRWIDAMVRFSVESSTREAFGAYLDSWARFDFSSEAREVDVPALAVVGEHDPALGEATMRATWMEHHPTSGLEVLANAGHYGMFETPLALATVVERFLDS